ncbi:MAG: hypothetical protein ACK5MA_10685 [Parachlamydiaceae bacterium]
MFAIGLGCAGLYGYAGVKASQAMNARKTALQLEQAVNNPIPKQEDQTAYVAIRCLGLAETSSWFPTEKGVLVGRFFMAKATRSSNPTINVTNSVCFPQELSLTFHGQEVIVHHLDLADWDGSLKTATTRHSPEETSILLNAYNLETDLSTRYKLKAEWFEGNQLTLFAQATRIGNRLYLKQPHDGRSPFIATTQEPSAYAASIKSHSLHLQKQAQNGALLATLIGSATNAYRIQHKAAKALSVCVAISSLTGGVKGLF